MQSYDSDRMYNKNMKTMFDFVKMAGCAAAFLMVVGCEETEIPGKAPELPVGEYNPVSLGIDVSQDGHVGGITQEDDGSYTIVLPDNGDPYIYLLPLEEDIEADNNVLAFEYKARPREGELPREREPAHRRARLARPEGVLCRFVEFLRERIVRFLPFPAEVAQKLGAVNLHG